MSFPTSPANNQVTLENGIAYTYNASRNAWYRTPATALTSITSNTVTVLNSIIFADGTSQTSAASPTDSYARTTANTATNNITILQGVNASQNLEIISADTTAHAAFVAANTKFSSAGGTITGSVTITNDLTVDGNLSFTGNVTSVTVSGNSGQFFGDAANGFNALYAGISLGYLIQPQITTQVTSDYDGYAGFNMQNINSGTNSSSDYFITADNGSSLDGFLDLGLAGSTYNYAGYSLLGPNDGYLIVSGNTSTGGGDLILGTQFNNDMIFAVNGINTENEVMRINSANNLVIKSNNPSTSNSTGSLQVQGGVGVTGNVSATGIIFADGTRQITAATNIDSYARTTANGATVLAQAAFDAANTGGGGGASISATSYNYRKYQGDGSTVGFTISSGHTANTVLVYNNGLCQMPFDDYTVSGTILTYVTAPEVDETIQIRELPVA